VIETEYPDILERQLHAEFWNRKSRGGETGEWFNLSEEDLDNLKGRDGYHEHLQYSCPILRSSATDVRPLRWGQRHSVEARGDDVPGRQTSIDRSGHKPTFTPLR
jgi:hypothetical protein